MTAIVHRLDRRLFLSDDPIYACLYWQPAGDVVISTRVCKASPFGGYSAHQIASDIAESIESALGDSMRHYAGIEYEPGTDWGIHLRRLIHDRRGARSAYVYVPYTSFLENTEDDFPTLLLSCTDRSLKKFSGGYSVFQRY